MGDSGAKWGVVEDQAPVAELPEFRGTYTHSLDEKGRVVVPAAFREAVNGGMTMTLSDGCVVLRPAAVWEEERARMAQEEQMDPRVGRQRRRVVMANAADVSLDRQGRIAIPANLRTRVQLHGEVHVMGMGREIEIWDPTLWDQYVSGEIEDLPGLAAPLALGGER